MEGTENIPYLGDYKDRKFIIYADNDDNINAAYYRWNFLKKLWLWRFDCNANNRFGFWRYYRSLLW